MSDRAYILIFTGVALVLAFAVSAPLRRPASQTPPVESMDEDRPVFAPAPPSERNQPNLGSARSTFGQPGQQSGSPAVYAEGTVRLSPAVKIDANRLPVVYLIVRAAEGGIVAVKKYTPLSFPFQFSVTVEDNMMGGGKIPAVPLTVIARLDFDGAAGPKQPEDREGSVSLQPSDPRSVDIVILPK